MLSIQKADKTDLQSILDLQYIAFQSEARLLNNYNIPPLKQKISDITADFQRGIILKAVDEKGRIVGSVRGYPENDTVYIGKLIVAPEMQGRGIGTKLLMEIENVYPDKRYEIFTSSESDKNIRLYEKLGYKPLKSEHISEQIKMVFLEKCDNLSF